MSSTQKPPLHRRLATIGLVTAMASALVLVRAFARAEDLPRAISDQDFWRLVTEFSEADGRFQPEYMSNEDSLQFVIPALKRSTGPGGAYLGVGPEQNFTYIAALRPKIAFVIDIRRDNMLEHLMYKALFELSTDRADFIGRLFSRKRPPGLDANASVTALFDAYQRADSDFAVSIDNIRAVLSRLTSDHGFQLSEPDRAAIAAMMNTFRQAGPYALRGTGDKNHTYAQLMAATDLEGRRQGYLASEENFRWVQTFERQNLLVPLVGDFAGDKAILNVGRYLKDHGALVNVFYVSNVERYLFDDADHARRFYTNVAALPIDSSSTFIRSVTVDISRRLGIPIPDGSANWRSLLSPIQECLRAVADGRLRTYRELFEDGR